jgi:predicted dehydrogenase
MALEAIRHGKHVYSEKPLALNAHDAREMVDAAKRAGVKTLVGFNYMKTRRRSWRRRLLRAARLAR